MNIMNLFALIIWLFFVGKKANAEGNVTYTVYTGGDGSCPPYPVDNTLATLMEPQAQEVGFCQNHGVGASLFNAIEVVSCTDKCLCFKQVAAETGDVNCDDTNSTAAGSNIKMTCFDKCLLDCNGDNCGETAEVGDPPNTRLMLTGSGPICASPVSEEDFVCETTGMILDENGNMIDAFTFHTTTTTTALTTTTMTSSTLAINAAAAAVMGIISFVAISAETF
mmetsp:Transcript_42776/g.70605  ORF Transcript_42776/g.70605 Transcript_42776/m.70605 type:complete len:223 (-) Transcript_42776:123-791(-)